MKRVNPMIGLAALACIALTACDDDATGLDDDSNFQVVLMSESSAAAMSQRAHSQVPDPLRAVVDLDAVTAITLPLGRVEAHQVGGAWVEAGLVNLDVDLLALPAGGIELVESELPEGDFDAIRLFLTGDATVTLGETIVVGRTTFEAGTHTLVIPSSGQTGLKLDAAFEVDADGEVLTVLFDPDATVRHVTATGSGVLKISPVLRVMDEEGDEVGGIDDEDDDEAEAEFEGMVQAVGASSFTLSNGAVVEVTADTEIDGDILSLSAVATAIAGGEVVLAEGEGVFAADGTTIIATEVEFETEDDEDGDGEVEVEGTVTAVDRAAATFTLDDDGTPFTVQMAADTRIEGDFATFTDMADAFDGGATIEAEADATVGTGGALVATEVEFEVEGDDASDFEGTVTAVNRTTQVITVELASTATLLVAITSTTVIDAEGDLTTFEAVADAFDAGATIEVEGEGSVDTTGLLTAAVVRFETG